VDKKIDKHTQEWLQIWAELSVPDSKAAGYKYLTGGFSNNLVSGGGTSQQSIMVPLQFWFCRNPGLALPLIALQYHEVKLKFTFGTGNNVSRSTTDVTTAVEVWVDYIYLDTDERRRFAQQSHEYLIEQLQYQVEGTANTSYKLNFNHPIKELIWTDSDSITSERTKISLNGHDRLAEQDREYFQVRQPLDHHTAVPGYNIKEMERPQLLSVPITLSALNAQALSGNDTTALDAALGTDNDALIGIMSATTNAATVTETGDGLSTITIRQDGTGTTFKVGDLLHVSLHSGTEVGSVSNTNTRQYEVRSILVNTAETADKTYTSLTLDRNVFLDDAIVNADDLEIRIVSRCQDPKSRCSQLATNVNVYSFALKPEEHQPSGTCNFSRIDTAKLEISGSVTIDNIYAVNYNVLRIMSGMGGLAYSN